jgi:hypothetical protein
MKPKTRDTLIYLAVGVSITALLVGQEFYARSHGKPPWRLTKFASRAATTPLFIGYFVAQEARRRLLATVAEIVPCVLAGTLLSLAVTFGFREAVGNLPTLPYIGFASLQGLLIVELVTRAIPYFRPRPGQSQSKQ